MPCLKHAEHGAPALLEQRCCVHPSIRGCFQSAWNVFVYCLCLLREPKLCASSAWKCGVCEVEAAVPVQLRRKQFATLLHLLEMLQEAVLEGPGTGGMAT